MVLDYHVSIIPLENADRILSYGELGNFSVAGFEMVLERHLSHYLITYYLPSGQFDLYLSTTRSNGSLRIVRGGVLDQLHGAAGHYPGQDGAPGHLVPGAGQHLQQHHHQHSQG